MSTIRKRMFRIGVYGTLGVAVLCFLAHPYTRQLAFGPKIRGEPLCSWQQSFRHKFAPEEADTLLTKVFGWMGIQSLDPDPWPGNVADMLPVVLSFVDDPSPKIREAVAESLGRYPLSPETGDSLTRMLDDPSPRVRASAVYSLLRETAYDPALPKLQKLMGDEDALCRFRAAYAVLCASKPNDKQALGVLLQAFKAKDRELRFAAAGSFSYLGKRFPEYRADIEAAAREHVVMRRGCALALRGFGPDAVPCLQEMLGDEDEQVRRWAIDSLRTLGPDAKAATSSLVRALADPDENVRALAASALSKIDPARFPARKAEPE